LQRSLQFIADMMLDSWSVTAGELYNRIG